MKTIGLLGGMSWESTELYYRYINEGVRDQLGGLHSARIAMVSVDFAAIDELQHLGRWDEAARMLGAAALQVEHAGADLLLLCTNTMHKVAPQIQESIRIPLLHIADPTGHRIRSRKIGTVGLLGTRFTMEEQFYAGKLDRDHGLSVVLPAPEERKEIHRVIYEELVVGRVVDESRTWMLGVIERLRDRGAEGVVLGCTEIPMLISQSDVTLPVFDTTRIHAEHAVGIALAGDGEGVSR